MRELLNQAYFQANKICWSRFETSLSRASYHSFCDAHLTPTYQTALIQRCWWNRLFAKREFVLFCSRHYTANIIKMPGQFKKCKCTRNGNFSNRLSIFIKSWTVEEEIWVCNMLSRVEEVISNKLLNLNNVTWAFCLVSTSPLLFIIFINDASDQLNHPCKQYANDTKLLAAIRNLTDIEKLQADINTIVKGLDYWV